VAPAEQPAKGRPDSEALTGAFERMGLSQETGGWLQGQLSEMGLSGEQIQGALGGLSRILPSMRAEGDAWVLDPGLASGFSAELGLSDAQVAKRIAAAREAVAKG
jgi:hypothetical protein